ncbi:MAG: hypothetical protein R3C03_16365 [Pirellulaceae bacterium]
MTLANSESHMPHSEPLSLLLDQMDAIRERNEAASLQNLPGIERLPTNRLLELACRDLLRSWRSPIPKRVEDYVSIFPQLGEPEFLLDLIDAEICAMDMRGTEINEQTLIDRFPSHANAIRQMMALLQVESVMNEQKSVKQRLEPVYAPPSPFRFSGTPIVCSHSYSGDAVDGLENKIWLSRLTQNKKFDCKQFDGSVALLKQIAHPRLRKIIDIRPGEDANDFWVVAERRYGTPLDQRINNAPGTQELKSWLEEMATAILVLEYAEIPPHSIPLDEVLVDHEDHLVVPSWFGFLAERCTQSWSQSFANFVRDIQTTLPQHSQSEKLIKSVENLVSQAASTHPIDEQMDSILSGLNRIV